MLESLLAVASKEGTFWLPPAISTVAGEIDFLYYFIYYLSVFFFILCIGGMVYLGVKYRRKNGIITPTHPLEGNNRLEIAWSIIPAIILIFIFAVGFRGFMTLNVAPTNTMDVNVYASTWKWQFEYPGLPGKSPDLVVPVDRPVKLTMISDDVIHSLFVPAFRTKQDVLPNRYTTLWFEAMEVGEYDLFCTEYCGRGHSMMTTPTHKVVVLEEDEYDAWVAKGGPFGQMKADIDSGNKTTYEVGEALFNQVHGCVQCHSMSDGKILVGPSLSDLFIRYGEKIPDNQTSMKAYLRRSMLNPNAFIVENFSPQMPTFKGRISEEEISWIYDYLKHESDVKTGKIKE